MWTNLPFRAGILMGYILLIGPLIVMGYGIFKRNAKLAVICLATFLFELVMVFLILNSGTLTIEIIFLAGIVFLILVPGVPIAITIIGKLKGKKRIARIGLAVIIAEIIFIGGYWFNYPTQYPYVDRWIIGRTENEIIQKYGTPYVEYDSYDRTIVYMAGSDFVFGDPYYYYIYFDENGKAVKCGIEYGVKGG